MRIREKDKLEKNKNFWIFLFVTCHTLLLAWLIYSNNIATAENDEFYFTSFLSGMYGEYIRYDMFENILFSDLVSFVFEIFSKYNWLIIIYLVIYFTAYNTIAYVIIDKSGNDFRGFLFSMLILLMSYQFIYKQINFTHVAGLATLAGIMVIKYKLSERDCSGYVFIVLGIALVSFGFMIRQNASLQSLIFLPVLFWENIRHRSFTKKQIVTLGVILGLLMVLFMVNRSYYADTEWRGILKRNILRAEINDYSMMRTMPKESVDWDKAGMSSEDYSFLMNWFSADMNVYSTEKLAGLVEYDHQFRTAGVMFKWIVKGILSYPFIILYSGRTAIFSFALFGIICMLLVWILLPKYRCEMIMTYVVTNLEICLCMILNRLLTRVIIIPLMCAAAISTYLLIESDLFYKESDTAGLIVGKNRSVSVLINTFIVIWIVFSMVITVNPVIHKYYKNPDTFLNFKKAVDTTESRDLYILHFDNYLCDSYSLFERPGFGMYSDCVFDAGWHSSLPYMRKLLDSFGAYNSPYEAMVNNDHVYFLDDVRLRDRLDFIRRHYDKDTDLGLVYYLDELSAYSVTRRIVDCDTDDVCTWNVDDYTVREGRDDYDFLIITGKIDGADVDKSYFMELNDGSLSYFYEVRVEDGRFCLGVPVETWQNSDSCLAYLYCKDKYGTVRDSETEMLDTKMLAYIHKK